MVCPVSFTNNERANFPLNVKNRGKGGGRRRGNGVGGEGEYGDGEGGVVGEWGGG